MELAQCYQTLGLNHDQIDAYLKDYGVRLDQLVTDNQLTVETADLLAHAVAQKKSLLPPNERASLLSLLHKAKATAVPSFSTAAAASNTNKTPTSTNELNELATLLPSPPTIPAAQDPRPIAPRTFTQRNPRPNNPSSEQDRNLGVIKFISEDAKHGYIVPLVNGQLPDLGSKDKGLFFYLSECEGQAQKGMLVQYEAIQTRTGHNNAVAIKTNHPLILLQDPTAGAFVHILKNRLSQHRLKVRPQTLEGICYANLFYKPGADPLSLKITEENVVVSKKLNDVLVHLVFIALEEKRYAQVNPLLALLLTNDKFPSHSLGIVKRIHQHWKDRPLAELLTTLPAWKSWPLQYFGPADSGGVALDTFILAGWLCGLFSYQASFDPSDPANQAFFQQLTPAQLDLLLEAGLRDQMEKPLLQWFIQLRIAQGFKLQNEQDVAAIEQSLHLWQQAGLFQSVPEERLQGNVSYRISLWEKGYVDTLDPSTIKQQLALLPSAAHASFLQKQAPVTLRVLAEEPSVANYYQQQASEKIAAFLNQAKVLCIDLEGGPQHLEELAWVTSQGSVVYPTQLNDLNLVLTRLQQALQNSPLVVGHHILQHDLPIIAGHGVIIDPSLAWDTLNIEWFLSPWRTSFGLVTQHHALADAKLTFELFQNQLVRLAIRYQHEGQAFVHLLPLHFRAALQKLFSEECWSLLKAAPPEQAAQRFFRPQQAPSPVPSAVQKAIDALPEDSLLIAPKILWPALAQRFPLVFHSISHPYALILNADRVKAALPEEHPALPAVLKFIRFQEGANRLPYWGALPMALQLAIGQERASRLCRSSQTYARASQERHVVALEEIDYYHHALAMDGPSQVLIIARSLALLQNKLLLGEIDYAFLYERLNREPIWMQLAGGQNIITLNREQCNKLAISVPEAAGNCWIEKGRQAKLRVYSAIDLSKQLAQLQSPQIEEVDWENSSPSKAIFLVKPDKKASGYIADQKRVNPESLYRLSYWAYQFQLLRGVQLKAPLVWLIQDSGEVAGLLAAARQKGYYIPDERAAMARQLELLHQAKGKKLMIVAIDSWADLLDLNYQGPLDYVWDSFKLYEQPQIQTDSLPSDRDEEVLADGEEQSYAPQKTQDLFTLIELQKPLIDHFAARVAQDDSRLLLLDSRLADYFGLADKWQAGSILVPLWRNETDYQQQVSELELFFRAPADPNNLPLNLKDAQEILRCIFLDVSQGQQWYPYQETHLEHILPAEKDLLISLPTGAGKSLLFQGPALFRSGFTNRLTLVITPLRALMEDQVSALWERGFLSNVEYISGDRSSVEMSDIYRRIAGGEITLLYLTPERFRSRAFENALLARMDADAGLEFVVFDEAHCISQWGQEFRPDYLSASSKLAGLIQQPQRSGKMLLFSATVSDQVFEDIKQILA